MMIKHQFSVNSVNETVAICNLQNNSTTTTTIVVQSICDAADVEFFHFITGNPSH